MKNKAGGWLEKDLQDPEFQRLCQREDFIESFLDYIEAEMKRLNITRAELARRMECRPSNITQMFRRTRNLTAATMVDIAFHLNLQMKLVFSDFAGNGFGRAFLPQPHWQNDRCLQEPLVLREKAVGPLLRIAMMECEEETQWQNSSAHLN